MEKIITENEKNISLMVFFMSIIAIYFVDLYMIFSPHKKLVLSPLYIVNIIFLIILLIYSHVRKKRLANLNLVLLRYKDKIMFILLYLLLAIVLSTLLYQEVNYLMDVEFLYATSLFTIGYLFNKPISFSEDRLVINNHVLRLAELQDCYDKKGKLIVLINHEEIIFKHLSNEEKNQVLEVFMKYQNVDDKMITAHNTTSEQRSTGR